MYCTVYVLTAAPTLLRCFACWSAARPCLYSSGIKVVGRIAQGIVKAGDEVEFVGIKPTSIKVQVTGEQFGGRVFSRAVWLGHAWKTLLHLLLMPGPPIPGHFAFTTSL